LKAVRRATVVVELNVPVFEVDLTNNMGGVSAREFSIASWIKFTAN
jgi:hypothetical protein